MEWISGIFFSIELLLQITMGCIFSCAFCVACSCCTTLVNLTFAHLNRLGYLLIVITLFSLASVIGKLYPNTINGYSWVVSNISAKVDLTEHCDNSYLDECIYRQLLYRASLALVITFSIFTLLVGQSNYFNNSAWVMKFLFPIMLFVSFWWVDNDVFIVWAELCRVISFIFLLVQSFLLFDFAHDLHDIIMEKDAEAEAAAISTKPPMMYKFLYLMLSGSFLICGIIGIVILFQKYSGCHVGMFYIVLTLLMGVLTMIASILSVVNKGVLTPSLMFVYSVFICWYALLSNPDRTCNPLANTNQSSAITTSMVVVLTISVIVLLYCIINGTRIVNAFNPSTTGVLKSVYTTRLDTREDSENNSLINNGAASESTPKERIYYQVLMIWVSCYTAMVLSGWGSSDGSPTSKKPLISDFSMWLKILTQWTFFMLYIRSLYVTYRDHL